MNYISLIFSIFFVDEYSKLDGEWSILDGESGGSEKPHNTLLNAQIYCSKDPNCFGVMVSTSYGSAFSNRFPIIATIKNDGERYIYKKLNCLGSFL